MTPQPPGGARNVCQPQEDVVAFLSSPDTFGGAEVTRIDTHLSHVFLAGPRVYKIKRAVRYDFADFSTPELRRRACENEVRINRRTAPEMYLGVVPIYRGADGPAWRGPGAPVEWAVEMQRFDADRQFDRLAARGALDESVIAALADKIARFHLDAERVPNAGGGDRVGRVIEQIAAAFGEQAPGAARWALLARAELARRRTLLDARARHGSVRRCHGDLHLANICMFDGAPTPFDAIEFNEELATTDVLYDLAFLLMDLVHYRRIDFANLILNRYLSVTRDYAGSGLLSLFQSMRAAVRAMVLSLPGQPPSSRREARPYFELALAFLEGAPTPRLIAIGGCSGTGKSTLAASLAVELEAPSGALLLQSDVIRKRLRGAPPTARLDGAAYSAAQTKAVYGRMLKDARRALRAGSPVILDATFLDPSSRSEAENVARRVGVPFDGLWLSAPRAILRTRVSARIGGVSDATLAVLEKQLQEARPPTDWTIIDAGRGPGEALTEARRLLPRT